jgi:ABC-2 type transport system ATP-binding protein
MAEPVVEVERLRRVFAGRPRRSEPVVALDGLSLTVAAGELHGLLGPNGAGKTTLVRILSTVLLPTSGSARVLGQDVVAGGNRLRRRIGIVFGGERGLYRRVSSRRNLLFWATMYGLDGRQARRRADALLQRVGLAERADEPVERLSRGMVQRLHLARGLVSEPEVVFLDEPTVGLDPAAALEFRALVRELRDGGLTIFLTTHDMDEAEDLCDRVSVIDHGRLLMSADTATIGRRLPAPDRVDFETGDERVVAAVRALPAVRRVTPLEVPGRWRAEPGRPEDVGGVLRVLVEHGVSSISTSQPRLEEVYLRVVGDRGMAL